VFEQRLRFRDLVKFRRRRKAFQRRRENRVCVCGAAGRLVKLRQRQRRSLPPRSAPRPTFTSTARSSRAACCEPSGPDPYARHLGAVLKSLAFRLRIAVGGDHDDGNVPSQCFGLGQHDVAAYSITSSVTVSSLSGIVRPSAFAVLRLITNSSFVTRATGISAGLSPFRTRPAYTPAWR
jgi:hypothetical protein